MKVSIKDSILLLCLFFPLQIAAVEKDHYLLLLSYHPDLPWVASVMQGMQKYPLVIDGQIELYVENMDSIRLKSSISGEDFKKYLIKKYGSIQFNGVLAEGDVSSAFIVEHGRSLFGDIPFVLRTTQELNYDSGTTVFGFDIATAVTQSVELAIRMRGQSSHIAVVHGDFEESHGLLQALLKDLNNRGIHDIDIIEHFTMEELDRRLRKLPHDTILFYTLVARDKAGNTYTPREVLLRMTLNAPVPVYVFYSSLMDTGTLGGHMMDGELAGRQMIQALVDYKNTGSFQDHYETLQTVLDYDVLVKFRMPVPWDDESIRILHYPIPVWASHPLETYLSLFIFVLLFILVIVLYNLKLRANRVQILQDAETILFSVMDGIMVLESIVKNEKIIDFKIKMINDKACAILKKDRSRLIGERLLEVDPIHLKPLESLGGISLFEQYVRVVETGEPATIEFYLETDHYRDWFQNRAVKFRNGFIVSFAVVTESRQLRARLEELNRQLSRRVDEEVKRSEIQRDLLIQTERMAQMGEMIRIIMHQWAQPLSILGMINVTIEDILEANHVEIPELKEELTVMDMQVRFLGQAMYDFKNFFRPSGESEIFSVVESIEIIRSMFFSLFERGNIELTIEPRTAFFARGVPNEFRHVVLNLLNNAREAIESKQIEKGQIQCIIDTHDNKGIVKIHDNGGGIPHEHLQRIFEPNFTTRGEKGTGIGLFICRSIIESHMQGRIFARNRDEGAEFVIEIPVAVQ